MSAEAAALPRPSHHPAEPASRSRCSSASPPRSRPASASCCGRRSRPTACCTATSASRTPRRSRRRSTRNGIPYKLDGATGAITVPADRVHDARLKLAGQGLPEGGGGFAVMSKDPGFGVSQFMEGARYQHALETELARTISNLQDDRGRARAPGAAAPVRVRARSRPAQRVGVPADEAGPPSRIRAGAGDRQSRRVEHSRARSRRRSRWSISRAACCPRREGDRRARRAREAARDRARHGRALHAAHRGDADAAGRARAACARRSWPRSRCRRPKKRANSIDPKARSSAANRPPRRAAATAPVRRACRAR